MFLGLGPHQVVLGVAHERVVGAVQELGAELLQEQPDGEGGPALRLVAYHRQPILRRLRLFLVDVEVQGVQLVQGLVVDQFVVADRLHRLHHEGASEPRVPETIYNVDIFT